MAVPNRSVNRVVRVHDLPDYGDLREHLAGGSRIKKTEPYNDVLNVVADLNVSDKLFISYKDRSSFTNHWQYPSGFWIKPGDTITGYIRPDTRVYVQGVYVRRKAGDADDQYVQKFGYAQATTLAALQDAWARSWGNTVIPDGYITYEDPDDPTDTDYHPTSNVALAKGATVAYGAATKYYGVSDTDYAFIADWEAHGDTYWLAYYPHLRVEVDGDLLYELGASMSSDPDVAESGYYKFHTKTRGSSFVNEPEEWAAGFASYPASNLTSFPPADGHLLTIETGLVGMDRNDADGSSIDEQGVHQGDNFYKVLKLPLFPISEAEWAAAGGTVDTDETVVRFLGFAYVNVYDLAYVANSVLYTPSSFVLSDYDLNPFSTSIDAVSQLYAGTASPITLRVDDGVYQSAPVTLPAKPAGTVTPYYVDIKADFDSTWDRFWGVELTTTEELVVVEGSPPLTEAPGGTLQPDWLETDKLYRATFNGGMALKHPLMPPGMGGAVAYSPQGTYRFLSRYGDYLLAEDPNLTNQAPTDATTVYWNPVPDGAAKFVASDVTFQNYRSWQTSPMAWSGVERREYLRSRLDPEVKVYMGGDTLDDGSTAEMLDVSAYLVEVNGGDVTLAGDGAIFDLNSDADNFPRIIRIELNGVPAYTGMLVSARSQGYANGNVLTLSTLPFSKFHDVDLSDVSAETITFPQVEEHYLKAILSRSGFHQSVIGQTTNPSITFRDTDFWTAAPPAGPGFVYEEVKDIYKTGSTEGSSTGEVRQLLQANMLEVHDLPTGDLVITPILPHYAEDIHTIYANRTLKYGVDANGDYVKEPRLDVQEVRLDLDERFAEVEVEGTSNEVEINLTPGWAHFWQAGSGETQQYFQKSLPAWKASSSSPNVWPQSEDPPGSEGYTDTLDQDGNATNSTPWTFMTHDGNAPVLDLHPLPWYDVIKLSKGNDTIEHDKTGGNRWISYVKLLKNPLSEMGTYGTDFLDFVQSDPKAGEVPETQNITLNTVASWGFRAWATGTLWSEATFEFKVHVPRVDQSLLKIKPLLGQYRDEFAPDWFPSDMIRDKLASLALSKPRKAQRVQNPYIAEIGSAYAVQQHGDAPTGYDEEQTYAASQLASWLTISEFLNTRSTTVRFAGAQPWWPGQFIAVARRPEGGVGSPVLTYDILLITESPEVDARVGDQAWTTTHAAYICSYEPAGGFVEYGMPAAWTPTYQS